ncbi:hypothetical protein CGRA01v4_11557 [Colletotrichum graminicola]|nr:hypothetical protein CGRA01v4_11557 [Colletotrichum graminicola]
MRPHIWQCSKLWYLSWPSPPKPGRRRRRRAGLGYGWGRVPTAISESELVKPVRQPGEALRRIAYYRTVRIPCLGRCMANQWVSAHPRTEMTEAIRRQCCERASCVRFRIIPAKVTGSVDSPDVCLEGYIGPC